MLREDATDSLRPDRILRREVAAASGRNGVAVGLVCVAVGHVCIVVVIVVVVIVVIVVVLQRNKRFAIRFLSSNLLRPKIHVPDYY